MQCATRLASTWILLGIIAVIGYATLPSAEAQTQGNNDVYGGPPNFGQAGSPAFIDASTFIDPQHLNICAALNKILNPANAILPVVGAVIDARGITGTTALTCADSPWAGIAASPSTILLPPGVIVIPKTWTLPDGTKIIGEGAGGFEGTNETLVSATTLQACNTQNCFTGSAMIQMGDSHCGNNSGICHSVSIEDLSLDGQSISGLDGIWNANAQQLSYVKSVNMYGVLGYGLSILGSAQNSGPYSNIIYNTGGIAGNGCAQIENVATRGIHGMTCESNPDSPTAIFLDAPNNTLEDIRIVGFYDGVLIGSKAAATGDVLRNIFGDTSWASLPSPVNVIHITRSNNVADVVIMGVGNAGAGSNTIKDELTLTTPLLDRYVSLYALGESAPVGSGNVAYSRFTTSPNAATWAAGKGDEGGNCAVNGSLYSNFSGTGTALWLCTGGSWQKVKTLN